MTPLGNAPNFRDVGPLPLQDGRTLRPGLLFRSGELSRLDQADLDRIETLGIRLVCDLRSAGERRRFASRWPALAPARRIDMPAQTDSGAGMQPLIERLAREPGPDGARRAMIDLYSSLPLLLAPLLREAVEAVTSGWGMPVLLHCHVGKDRTGVATALLLSAVGVRHEAILADYRRSDEHVDIVAETRHFAKRLAGLLGGAIPPGTLDMLGRTDPAYLEAAFTTARRQPGGIDGYFTDIGLTPERRARLQSLLAA